MAARKKSSTVRGLLVDTVKPLLPRGWKFFPYRVPFDAITSTTVWVRLQSIEKVPEAPQSGCHLVTFIIVLAVPDALPGEADARLDDEVLTLVMALDQVPSIRRATAVQGLTDNGDSNLGFEITVEFLTFPIPNKE